MAQIARRAVLLGGGAALGAVAARSFGAQRPSMAGTQSLVTPPAENVLNDASGLSPTPVHRHIIVREDPGQALVDAVRAEIAEARAEGRPFNVGAARHSMGGQAIPRDGHAMTFDNGRVEIDGSAQTYRCHAGARWSQVIAALDPVGLSPKVMQSNNDFGVAATYSVNAHGWPVKLGPMGATVRSVDMVLADGTLVTASRSENTELFNAAMGGYGLIGAITALEVEAAPNRNLVPTFERMPAGDFGPAFAAAVSAGDVDMAYGRLNVDRARFFEDALMVTYRAAEDQNEIPTATGSGWLSHVARDVFRAQLGNEWVKRRRWWFETDLGPRVGGGQTTRNQLINEPVVTLDDGDPNRTDILHEYFVAVDQFPAFLDACREVIPASYQEMLNITLRWVDTDAESLLSYAPVPRIACVMLFSQEMTARAEADMQRMTQALIDRVHAIGGSYYLPYRLHATPAQFAEGYPGALAFAAFKRQVDPTGVFRTDFWTRYLERL
ncbi:FAD-binding protein [Pseudaestuariivita sp.]|uniref:FAD-binding protein n=1 Tax=Pseudaestuariivita sp. TaxID=2211669 RepID=UPI0040581CB6